MEVCLLPWPPIYGTFLQLITNVSEHNINQLLGEYFSNGQQGTSIYTNHQIREYFCIDHLYHN